MERHIFLIGMPGSGKSALGRRVALKLQVPYLDTDAYLTEISGMNTAQIYLTYGETAFRDGETQLLRELISASPGIISTGGGTPLREENRRLMRANGYVVLIDRPIDDILMDIREEKRPLLAQKGRGEIERIYNERMPIYREVADVVLDNGQGFHNGLAALEMLARQLGAQD
ncbi:MAG: shikimate kinase [Eubacteriales bacterium]|nr:shikimate kinase [Eubacteriales bacterium]